MPSVRGWRAATSANSMERTPASRVPFAILLAVARQIRPESAARGRDGRLRASRCLTVCSNYTCRRPKRIEKPSDDDDDGDDQAKLRQRIRHTASEFVGGPNHEDCRTGAQTVKPRAIRNLIFEVPTLTGLRDQRMARLRLQLAILQLDAYQHYQHHKYVIAQVI